ncbi:hypothetical protein SISNIDRAFT_469127 [Sistotremastrum niveocremeum HHB9708]|uniref:F-box domain-containing protein n=1 Tax=Sistotremastrum niveocremeum HHB9708 TaxID=1314777 RepID=A0A164QFF3_9AGAM|nr:hypothetical protein SISNIDRAFT_469127 [Sistotremastrum niveocremeum HHB9708]
MNVANQLSRRELSACGQSSETTVPELMDVLERSLNEAWHFDSRELESTTHSAPMLREIAKHLRSACSTLGRISNMQTPIGRLHDEVLAEILLSAKVSLVADGCFIDPCEWEYLLRICSRWTTIIHEDPRFWGAIDFAWNQTTIARFLSLSQDSLLSLRIPASDNFLRDRQDLLMPIVKRAKDINFRYQWYHSEVNHCSHTKKPPRLIDASSPNPASSISEPVSIEDKFAATRCLEESLIAPAPHLSQLTCPELGSLDIIGIPVNPAPANLQRQDQRTISALQLRHISVDGMLPSEWDYLFRHIRAPVLSEINFTIALESRVPLPAFLQVCAAEASHAKLVFDRSDIACTYSGRRTASNVDFKHVMSILFEHNYLFSPDDQPGQTQVKDQIIGFAQLTCLTIEINCDTGLQWGTLLGNMSGLVALNVRGHIGADFFEALSGRTDTWTAFKLPSIVLKSEQHCGSREGTYINYKDALTESKSFTGPFGSDLLVVDGEIDEHRIDRDRTKYD